MGHSDLKFSLRTNESSTFLRLSKIGPGQ